MMRFREIAKEKFYFYAEKRPIKVWDVNAKDTVTNDMASSFQVRIRILSREVG